MSQWLCCVVCGLKVGSAEAGEKPAMKTLTSQTSGSHTIRRAMHTGMLSADEASGPRSPTSSIVSFFTLDGTGVFHPNPIEQQCYVAMKHSK